MSWLLSLEPWPEIKVRVPMLCYRRADGTLIQPRFRQMPHGRVLVLIPGIDSVLICDDLPTAISDYTELAEDSRRDTQADGPRH